MFKTIKNLFVVLFLMGCFFIPSFVLAHLPRLVYLQPNLTQIQNPEISQAFYGELKGQPQDYFINSDKDFELYVNILVPELANINGRYSANIFSINDDKEDTIATLDSSSSDWLAFYEEFGRDYYLKGPEITKQVPAGRYRIEVYSLGYSLTGEAADNLGKYVLAVGKKESFDVQSVLNVYWQIPLLKVTFFKTSVLQFFLTPFGIAGIGVIGGLLILSALIYYLIGFIKMVIKHNQAKTLLLISGGMSQMKDEVIKLLQKPAYDVTVAFITTAAKPEEDIDYLKRDWDIMKDELGFNLEEVDIEGKSEHEVMKLLELKDIIFVEGGNTFYLLKAMRACKFEKVIRELLKQGKVYIGVSAGSIVAGKTIKPSFWYGENKVGLKDLKGLNLVPFDIAPHFDGRPELVENIKKYIKNPEKRAKKLRIITDDQAILVQGKEIDLIGDGEAVVI